MEKIGLCGGGVHCIHAAETERCRISPILSLILQLASVFEEEQTIEITLAKRLTVANKRKRVFQGYPKNDLNNPSVLCVCGRIPMDASCASVCRMPMSQNNDN